MKKSNFTSFSGILSFMLFLGVGALWLWLATGIPGGVIILLSIVILIWVVLSNYQDNLNTSNTDYTSNIENNLKSKEKILKAPSLTKLIITNYSNPESLLNENVSIFDSSENYYKIWQSLIVLQPELNGKRISCHIIEKWDNFDEGGYRALIINLIKDRELPTSRFFENFGYLKSLEEKINWHNYQLKRLLQRVNLNNTDFDYESIRVGYKLSFEIKYNQPICYILSEDESSFIESNQFSWDDIYKYKFDSDFNEYEFYNFKLE